MVLSEGFGLLYEIPWLISMAHSWHDPLVMRAALPGELLLSQTAPSSVDWSPCVSLAVLPKRYRRIPAGFLSDVDSVISP